MPPQDCEGWMYDPPRGVLEGEDPECGDDAHKILQRDAALQRDDICSISLSDPR